MSVHTEVDQWSMLAHSDCFITHHGLNSTHEAIFHRVAMISFPFFWDQPALAAKCQALGLAIPLTDVPRGEVRDDHIETAWERYLDQRDAMRTSLDGGARMGVGRHCRREPRSSTASGVWASSSVADAILLRAESVGPRDIRRPGKAIAGAGGEGSGNPEGAPSEKPSRVAATFRVTRQKRLRPAGDRAASDSRSAQGRRPEAARRAAPRRWP